MSHQGAGLLAQEPCEICQQLGTGTHSAMGQPLEFARYHQHPGIMTKKYKKTLDNLKIKCGQNRGTSESSGSHPRVP